MTTDCIFCKIIKKEIPANIFFENDDIVAFDDINPAAPIHKLVVPKRHIETLNDLKPNDMEILGKMMQAVQTITKDLKIDQSGYRVVINCNKEGGQAVYHIHMHLLGGKPLGWTPD